MANLAPGETLISFESGHYKKTRLPWTGDTQWIHFRDPDTGHGLHVNKDLVEYMETGPYDDRKYPMVDAGMRDRDESA